MTGLEIPFFLYLLLAIAVWVWARRLDRSGFLWFLLSLLLSPVVTGILLLILGPSGKACPKCAETVRREAVLCKHCGHRF